MKKQLILSAVAGATILGLSACGGDFKKSGSVEYKIVKDNSGKNAAIGDVVEFNVRVKIGDSVLADSYKDNGGRPAQLPIQAPQMPADWTAALTKFSKGDSGVIRVFTDSIKKYMPNHELPPFMKLNQWLSFEIKVIDVKSEQQARADMQKTMMEENKKQTGTDEKLLQDYFAKNNLKPMKTASGLYYIISSEGSGSTPAAGQEVTVNYTGRTLDGHVFDSNEQPDSKHKEPLKFIIGAHQVIPGWDEGVALLKKGAKAKLFIPSTLAYGAQSPSPELPANSILAFDVAVLDIKNAPAPQGGPEANMQTPPTK